MTEQKLQLEDWLDDLCVRFIINLPKADLSSVERICFQVEEAQWFYEDFIRPQDPRLPSMSLRAFCHRIFQHCTLLAPFADNHMKAFDEFMDYKQRVPVRGAILLNEAMDSAVLVKGWKSGAGWSFPRGKINMDEDDLDCAIREVDEEIGFDIRRAGLVPRPDEVKYIETTMREQQIRLYVFRNIPMDTPFEPKTRKEISKIAWYKISDLPGTRKKGNNGEGIPAAAAAAIGNAKFYMVAPFLGQLKRWVAQQKKRDGGRPVATSYSHSPYLPAQAAALEEPLTEDDTGVQTDVGVEEPVSAPSLEALEGATQQLQRLLKVQPPTQGLQPGSTEPDEGIQLDKGGALMALLRNKASSMQSAGGQPRHQPLPAGSSQLPHTPFDHVYTDAPQPNTPHHHHPGQLLSPNDYQAPPNFPLAQHTNHVQGLTQHQQLIQSQLLNQTQYLSQNQPPNYQNQPGRNAQVQAPNYQNHYGPNHNQQMQQQQQQQYMNQQRMNPMGPQRHPQKAPEILHPQPLPPQAQSILTRSMLPTPQLPEPHQLPSGGVGMGGPGAFSGQMGAMESQLANASQARAPAQQRQLNQPPAQINSHAMSLLNAFKTGPARNAEQQPSPVSQGQAVQPPGMAPTNQHPQIPGQWQHDQHSAGRQHTESSQPPYVPALADMLQRQPNVAARAATLDGPRLAQHHQPPVSEAHRSTLLDMFKKQVPLSPPSGNGTTVKPVQPAKAMEERPTQNPVFAQSTAQVPSTAQAVAVAVASQTNGGPVAMNPELNLPFRALQLLSRPKQAENIPSDKPQGSNSHLPSPGAQAQRDVRHTAPLAASSANQHATSPQVAHAYNAVQGRGQAFHPQASNAPYDHVQYPGPSAASPKSFSAASMLANRQESTPEQTKKLLSLFGNNPKPSPAGLPVYDKGKMKETGLMDQPKSRMASLSHASASGDGAQIDGSSNSRRGSATPISPSDRDFLLNYLASVTKQAL